MQTRLIVTGAATDTIRLDASQLTIDGASDARGQAAALHGGHRPRHRAPGAAGRRWETPSAFTLRYHGHPERGMYFVPRRRVMWTQGETTENHSWVPTYDAPNDKTTWEILVTADSGVSVLSNGRLVEVTPAAGGAQQVWHWSQELPGVDVPVFDRRRAVQHPARPLARRARSTTGSAPDTVNAGWRAFGETPSMIETYSRVLGVNFPWAKYDQSIIPDFTYGGMENVSATTQTDLALHGTGGEPEQSGRGLNAHELAHQWFGDLTTTATWAHIWLNEGLTTYMESVHNEKSRGWSAGQWSWINQQSGAMHADQNGERPLVLGEEPGTDPITLFFSGHVYPKGAQVAHQLRRLLGDSVFWAGMQRFLTDNAYQPVETADFAIAMEKVSGRDLDWFFDQWAYGIGYPKVTLTREWNAAARTLAVTVCQSQAIDSTHPFFRFPATIRIVTRDSVVRREIMVTEQDQRFVLSLPEAPITFRFDEGGWLLGTVKTDQTPEELAELAKHDLEFAARFWALGRLDSSTSAPARDARRFILLNEPDAHLRSEAMRQVGRYDAAVSGDLILAGLGDAASEVRASAIVALARGDTAAAQAQAVRLITTDPSFSVQASALGIYDPAHASEGTALLLDRIAHGGSLDVRTRAAERLSLKPDAAGLDALEALARPEEPRNARGEALYLLAEWPTGADRAVAVATRYLSDGDPLFASQAVRTLARIGGASGRATLTAALASESRVTVRAAIARALAPKS